MMMSAEHPDREEIMALLDGELPTDREAVVRDHIETCDACRSFADELTAVSRHLASWRVDPVPVALSGAAFSKRTTNKPSVFRRLLGWRIRPWQLAGAIALVAIVIVVSLPELRQRRAAQVSSDDKVATGILGAKGDPAAAASGFGLAIARTASVRMTVADLTQARAALEAYLAAHRGYIAQLEMNGEPGAVRMLVTTVRVPVEEFDGAFAMLRRLGHVTDESQASDDVTSQVVDLDARLANSRRTEERLAGMVRNRTEKVGDLLAVERELSRVRGEIEQMEAQQRQLTTRIDFVSIDLRMREERRAGAGGVDSSIRARLQDAAFDGLRSARDVTIALVLVLLRVGPTLVFWGLGLAWPLKLLLGHRAGTQRQ